MKICSIEGCGRKSRYNSPQVLCYPHYKRWWRKGNFDTEWYKPGLSLGYFRVNINGKRVLQHRQIVESYLGRKLTRKEIIHHINGDKTDNRIENMEIMTQSEHMNKLHHNGGWSKRREHLVIPPIPLKN